MRLPFAVMAVWAVIIIVPVLVYGFASAVTGLQPPGDSAATFLLSVAVSKFGTALAFLLIYSLAQDPLKGQWLAYAGLWFVMSPSAKSDRPSAQIISGKKRFWGPSRKRSTFRHPVSLYHGCCSGSRQGQRAARMGGKTYDGQ